MRIIIVEDEQRARRGLKNLLQVVSDECEIVADSADGKNALELIRKLKPDVVFTDIKMPFMDGLTLISEVKKFNSNIRFIVVSAYEEFEYARQALTMGVVGYLVKPIIMDDIKEVVLKLSECTENKDDFINQDARMEKMQGNIHPLIKKAIHIIEKDYALKISQKDLAIQLGISPEYFSYLFTRETGESFIKYLKKYRINIAKTLLMHGDVSRYEVPEKVGFCDEKYFNKVFREVTGMSITEYLRMK